MDKPNPDHVKCVACGDVGPVAHAIAFQGGRADACSKPECYDRAVEAVKAEIARALADQAKRQAEADGKRKKRAGGA